MKKINIISELYNEEMAAGKLSDFRWTSQIIAAQVFHDTLWRHHWM